MVNRGSEWHKWDLHVHTASSFDYGYKGTDSDDRLVKSFKENNISAVAITDHFIIDKDRINKLRELSSETVFFPGVELRTDKGNTNIHIVAIFSDKYDIKVLEESFNVFKRDKGKNPLNDEKIYWDFNDIVDFVKKHNGLLTIHAGSKESGVDRKITNALPINEAIKEEFAKNIHIFEVGKQKDIEDYKKKVLPDIKKEKPIIICSDNHDPREYASNLWIKADLTFEGLKQIIYEPDRVKNQQAKPEEKPVYQVISSVELNKDSFWKQKINFNENLNTIIGGRSTGKSNLLAAIANKLSCYSCEDKSDKKEFINNISKDIKIIWKDNVEKDNRKVEFLSQNKIHELSKEENKKDLNTRVEGIIKEKNTTVIDNYNTFKQNQEQKINTNIKKLFPIMQNMKSKIESMKSKGDKKGVEGNIKLLEDRLSGIKINGELLEQEIKQYNEGKQKINDYLIRINTITKDISKIDYLLNENIIKEDILNNYIELSDDIKDKISQIMVNVKQEANNLWKEKLSTEKEILETEKECKEGEIEKIKNKAEYKNTEQNIEKNKEYKALQDELDKERAKLKEIEKEENEIKTYQQQIDELKDKIITDNYKFFEEIKTTIGFLQQNGDKVKIKPTVKLDKKLYDTIIEYINIKHHQEYKEVDKVNKDYMTNIKFFNSGLLDSALENNLIMKTGKDIQMFLITLFSRNLFYIDYQLEYENDNFEKMSDGKKAFVILTMILEYSNEKCPVLIDQPEDSLDNRSIYNELSKYLKQKKKERQIILVTHNANIVVNTDAENVIVANQNGTQTKNRDGIKFQYINGSLESTKKKDSSEFILESQGIREHVCEILEGGKDAFYKREQKYGLD
ncbi:TrlF family AAA-like ATPase [Candidatus Ruminimicrobium bovinum]|uniref:TrlF family AAA-like ATPase n=1 Tax=Candidatus Ruminimicrobium bovinum TaxID=3242779 RepID=UPI0039B8CDC3